jgi:hypothetical protein
VAPTLPRGTTAQRFCPRFLMRKFLGLLRQVVPLQRGSTLPWGTDEIASLSGFPFLQAESPPLGRGFVFFGGA